MKLHFFTVQWAVRTFILLCLMISVQFIEAQERAWTANWIWTSDQGPNNTWVDLRKKVTLKVKPVTAITRIAAENKYWLFINNTLVVRDGGLDTRPNLKDTYYDEIDLAPYLKKGENIICVLVWHKGSSDGYTQRTLPNGGFLFDSKLSGSNLSSIVSDNTWKIKADSAFVRGIYNYKYGVTGTIKFDKVTFGDEPIHGVAKAGYYRPAGSTSPFIKCANEDATYPLPGTCDVAYGSMDSPLKIMDDFKWVAYPVTFDARNEKQGWHLYGYKDSSWKNAVAKGVPPIAPWNKLVNRTIPFWKDYGLNPYTNQASLPASVSTDTTITGTLGINIQGTPYLKVNAPAGVHIRIVLNDFYYQEYITKEGEQEFECYEWQNSSSHTVQYQFTNVHGTVRIQDLKFRQSSYNTEIRGSFKSNDSALNTLWTKCKNTSFVCMRDYFFDCPNRERGQWWGDVSEQIQYSFYLYDQSSVKLAQKAYRELMYTQKEDGSLFTTAPGKAFNLPDQNMAAVSLLWNYYMYTGDKALLEELYPFARKFIQQCASTANGDGMLIMQPAQGWKLWNWIDWGSNMDIQEGSANTVCNALYSVLLNNMMHIATALGKEADISYYQSLQTKVKNNFNDYFWNGKAYVFNTKNGVKSATVDDRSGAWAVLAGMVDDAKKPSVLNTLRTRYDASPYQEMYIEQAMLQLDPTETLNRMRNRYSDMINSWSSTLWEEFPANNSNNHAWSVGPLYHLSSSFLGVKPLKPAFVEYAFLPLMGDLKKIAGVVPTPQGDITANCTVDKALSTFTQEITSPANTVCIIGVPKQVFGKSVTFKEVKTGSDIIWQNGSALGNVAGVEFYEEDAQFIKFKVQPGKWVFTSVANDPANAGITTIVSPKTKIGLNKAEAIKVKVFNENKTEQVNVKVSYIINNGASITEFIPSIPPQSNIDYTFAKTANFSACKEYKIAVKVQAPVDHYALDDTLSTTITNYPTGLNWALLFSGTGFGKISIPHSADLAMSSAFTLEAWIYPTGFKSNYWENTVVSTETNNGGYALDIGGNGQGRLVIYSDGGWKEAVLPVGSIALNKWQHIAGTFDGSTLKFYVDGVLKTTASAGELTPSTGPLYIGESSAWSGREFNGGIDEVQIWKKVLSEKEIKDYKDYRRVGNESGLVAYYKLNEGIDSPVILDGSSNHHNGSFLNLDTHTSWMTGISLPSK